MYFCPKLPLLVGVMGDATMEVPQGTAAVAGGMDMTPEAAGEWWNCGVIVSPGGV